MSVTLVLIISIAICILVIFISALTTSKAYTSVKHTVDPIENNPHLKHMEKEDNQKKEEPKT